MGEPTHSPLFTDLRELLGGTAAQTLVELFGATVMLVPARAIRADPLVLLLGESAAARLAELYGGELVQLPPRAWRPGEIAALRARGLTISEIAALVGVSGRRVYQVLANNARDRDREASADA